MWRIEHLIGLTFLFFSVISSNFLFCFSVIFGLVWFFPLLVGGSYATLLSNILVDPFFLSLVRGLPFIVSALSFFIFFSLRCFFLMGWYDLIYPFILYQSVLHTVSEVGVAQKINSIRARGMGFAVFFLLLILLLVR